MKNLFSMIVVLMGLFATSCSTDLDLREPVSNQDDISLLDFRAAPEIRTEKWNGDIDADCYDKDGICLVVTPQYALDAAIENNDLDAYFGNGGDPLKWDAETIRKLRTGEMKIYPKARGELTQYRVK